MLLDLLIEVVDVVLVGSGIDEKFLGVTLFALVPNTTEFMNAISFAMNGNIALRFVSMYFIGRVVIKPTTAWKLVPRTHFKFAYCRSRLWSPFLHGMHLKRWEMLRKLLRKCRFFTTQLQYLCSTGRLIFPRWDVIVIILSVFLLTYTYIEAKSNYHRGSILILRSVD